MSHELYKKYRPTTLGELVGQQDAIRVLKGMFQQSKIPHAILLSGPSGTGKTTIARIIKDQLKCQPTDFMEYNAADFKGIDTIRSIRAKSGFRALKNGARVWLLDEAHKLTRDAQDSALKMIEDTKPGAYYIFATTDADKLITTLRNRCSTIHLKAVPRKEMLKLLEKVSKKEKIQISEDVAGRIVEVADGSPRRALVLLEQVSMVEGEEEKLDCIQSTDLKTGVMNLVNKLMPYKTRPNWKEVVQVLRTLEDEPETVRHIVLACAKNVLLKESGQTPKADRAFLILQAFRDNFYDSKHAGLVAACYEVFSSAE